MWAIAQLELAQEKYQDAAPRLAEAWAILERLGRAEGIAAVGATFGQLLAAAGTKDQALAVLAKSAAACRKLGRAAEAQQVEGIIQQVERS